MDPQEGISSSIWALKIPLLEIILYYTVCFKMGGVLCYCFLVLSKDGKAACTPQMAVDGRGSSGETKEALDQLPGAGFLIPMFLSTFISVSLVSNPIIL